MPSPRLSPKMARLFAFQMVGTVMLLVLVLAFIIYNTRPNHPLQTTGGIDTINSVIAWIAFTGILFALSMVQIILARQMFSEAKGTRRGIASW